MTVVISVLFTGTQAKAEKACVQEYRRVYTQAIIKPIKKTANILGYTLLGGSFTVGGVSYSATQMDTEISTAASLYGAALFYESEYHLTDMLAQLRNFNSRITVKQILEQSLVEMGDELYEFIDEVIEERDNQEIVALETAYWDQEVDSISDFKPQEIDFNELNFNLLSEEEKIVKLIQEGNTQRTFCNNKKNFYTRERLKKFIIEELDRQEKE
jgi:hypothetical protein